MQRNLKHVKADKNYVSYDTETIKTITYMLYDDLT